MAQTTVDAPRIQRTTAQRAARRRYCCERVTQRPLYRVLGKLFGWFAKRQARGFTQKLGSLAVRT